jgi:hypothetical protein
LYELFLPNVVIAHQHGALIQAGHHCCADKTPQVSYNTLWHNAKLAARGLAWFLLIPDAPFSFVAGISGTR